MAAVVYEIVSRFESVSGDADEMENRWVWAGDSSADIGAICDDLVHFYGTAQLGSRLGDELSRSTPQHYAVYDITAHLSGTPHGPPIFTQDNSALYPPASDDSLPGQIAICVDYHADLAGVPEFGAHTRPRARLRGRHYYGPVCMVAYEQDSLTRVGHWTAAAVTGILGAHTDLLSSTHFGPGWSVWSRKNASVARVVGGWVDTTPHRARRREEPTNIKVFWP